MALTMERCDSVAQEEEIKALFLRNERPTFAAFFDRAYRYAMSAGGASWVARNGPAGIVGHQAVFPRSFADVHRVVQGALFVDSLFDRPHRNFWSAVELCRRTLADLRDAGRFDFAYTDPTPPALAVLRATGFTTIGTFQRFVLPLNPLYLGVFRIRSRPEPLSVARAEGLQDTSVAEALRTLRPGAQFRVERSLELYATRLGGETIPSWQWLLLRPERDPGSPVAALVLTTRPPGQAVLSVVDVLWDEARVSAASVLHAMARTARAEGFKKLSMLTLAESRLARSLERCGFIRREGTLPLVVQRIREDAVLPPVQDWVLTYFDGSAW
ncbi:MAG: hypothetical protein AUG79_02855 [Gemmatimonadetes bacterium 13_1_20CM_4_69_16]|nr:MAG: hypothetical protein AUG79_02855 [Gemmatimonadetes bacterium 13_1_20CM_4_69_16]